MSSGSPMRSSKTDDSRYFFAFGSALKYSWTPGVFIVPGEIALTLTFLPLNSLATD